MNTKENKFPIQSVLYGVWLGSYSHYNARECYEVLNKIKKSNFDFILRENAGSQKSQLQQFHKIVYSIECHRIKWNLFLDTSSGVLIILYTVLKFITVVGHLQFRIYLYLEKLAFLRYPTNQFMRQKTNRYLTPKQNNRTDSKCLREHRQVQ